MKPEIATIEYDPTSSPHAQEVEFALILARMINTVKQDPSQLRFTVYEFARSRLESSISWADEEERKRLLGALEVAIKGVEQFSLRVDQSEQLQGPNQATPLALGLGPVAGDQVAVIATEPGVYRDTRGIPSPGSAQNSRRSVRWFGWIAGGGLLAGAIVGALYLQRAWLPPPAAPAPQASPPVEAAKVIVQPQPSLPLPTDYGIYVLNDGKLSELEALSIQVPDKRVALSTPVSQPSKTILPEGRAKFVAFRRDFAGNAPERADIRVVAQIVRALTFDSKGKASYSPVSDEWSIRNTAYEFRVRPIAGNPEMLLIQPENADFTLPPGRYVLALKNQGYDFSVAGEVTDLSHCLERTDASNGTFYSDCPKP